MGRKCSHCGKTGHNSRTCRAQRESRLSKFKLFGVDLTDDSAMKKSFSMDCLPSSMDDYSSEKFSSGYLSDGLITKTHESKKGVAWSEEEHRVFLVGLEKLGKGDWRGISRKFVTTRTPTQVASHAQKYFLRLNSLNNRPPRRHSLFDVVRDKLTVQVAKSNQVLPSSIPFVIVSDISSQNDVGSNNLQEQGNSESLPIWFNHGAIISSSSMAELPVKQKPPRHRQSSDLHLSLWSPKSVEQAAGASPLEPFQRPQISV